MTAPHIELITANDDDADFSGLLSFLQDEEFRCYDDELNSDRAVALDFYNGEPFGDEEDGHSQVVTRDVQETIDPAVTSILRTMVSGDNVVEFECGDKRLSEIITAAVGQEFYQGQNGYRVLHDWIKAGLLEKTATCKVCIEEQSPLRREAEVSAEELALASQEGRQFIAAIPLDDEETMWRVAWLEDRPPLFRDYVVPNEEFGVAADARDLDEDCVYLHFRMPRTASQIAEMGYDTDGLDSSDYYAQQGELSTARDGSAVQDQLYADSRTGSNRRVWLLEEYCRYDLDGDGISELLKVHRVGGRILNVESIEEQPGVVWCPFPMPSRIVGQSLADKVMDIQRTRSVLFREALDNMYLANRPRVAVSESSIGDNTIDDLLTTQAGGLVRYTGAVPPQPWAIPFVAADAFQALQILSGEKESRTGITRLNQGLDPDALNLTATGTAMMQASGQQMEDYMARNFAEAFARLMVKKYNLMRQYGKPMEVYVDGEHEQTDPRSWPEQINTRVRVGLGTGRKDQRLQYRMNLLQITQQAASSGMRIFNEKNVYNQIAGVIEDSSLGQVSQYITDPDTLGPEQEQPNPEMMKAQAQAMMDAEKLKAEQQKTQGEMMLKARQMQQDAALNQQKLDYELQAKREEAALNEQLARDKAVFEANLAQQQADREWQLSLMQMEQQREIAEKNADMKNYREGGALDE